MQEKGTEVFKNSTEAAFTAEGDIGAKDFGLLASGSASIIEVGIDIDIKLFGKQVSINLEAHIGSVGVGGSISPAKGSLGVNASAGVGGSLNVAYEGDGESFVEDSPEPSN